VAFKIDGNTLTNQPSRVEVSYEGVQMKLTADGSQIAVEPSSKRRVRVTWGVDGTKQAVTEELKTLRTSALVSLTYDDTDGSETTIASAYMPLVPSAHMPGGDSAVVRFQAPISLEFLEM